MRALLSTILVLSLTLSNAVFAKADNTLPVYSQFYDDTRDPFIDAEQAIALAKKTNRQVLIEIGGNWCGWCKKMDKFLTDNPKVYQQLHQNYVLLKVNVSDSNENAKFMEALPPTVGYPHMYVSTNKGEMLLSKDTAELLYDGQYSVDKWLAFLDKWQIKAQNNALNNKG